MFYNVFYCCMPSISTNPPRDHRTGSDNLKLHGWVLLLRNSNKKSTKTKNEAHIGVIGDKLWLNKINDLNMLGHVEVRVSLLHLVSKAIILELYFLNVCNWICLDSRSKLSTIFSPLVPASQEFLDAHFGTLRKSSLESRFRGVSHRRRLTDIFVKCGGYKGTWLQRKGLSLRYIGLVLVNYDVMKTQIRRDF